MTSTGVSNYLSYFDKPLGLFLSVFAKFCPRLSVELDPLRQSAGEWLWFSSRWSNCPLILCRASQEAVLQRSGHILVANILSFHQQMFKFDWVIIGEFDICQPF